MTLYIVVLFLLLILGLLYYRNFKYTYNGFKINVEEVSSIVILLLVAALRGVTVGADTRQYQIIFELCGLEKWSDLATSTASYTWFKLDDIELGYKYINKLIYCINSEPQTITVINSFFLIGFMYLYIKKYSKDVWLSLLLFYAFGFFQLALNLTPSSIATFIVLLGIKEIDNEKPFKFFLYVLAGSIFHYSAFIFLLVYPLTKIGLNGKRFWSILIISFIGITFLYPAFFNLISRFIPSKYINYLRGSDITGQFIVYVVQLLGVGYCVFCCKSKYVYEKYSTMFWFFLLESAAYFLSMHAKNLNRVAFLFSPIILILIPSLLDQGHSKRGISVRKLNVIIYMIVVYLARISINNIGTTMPYVFFWQ